jgi:hypothetical protein
MTAKPEPSAAGGTFTMEKIIERLREARKVCAKRQFDAPKHVFVSNDDYDALRSYCRATTNIIEGSEGLPVHLFYYDGCLVHRATQLAEPVFA